MKSKNTENFENLNLIFTNEFCTTDVNLIIKELREKGYYAFPNAITNIAIKTIENDATKYKLNLNENKICGVYYEKQYYLTNLLLISKKFYDFVTSKFIFDICRNYLGNNFRLKALRYYETYGGHHMQWHTDNKTDRNFAHIPGIIFIFYVSNVDDGQFQYVEGSHLWSGEKAYSDYSDDFIEINYKDKIKDFKLPSGSLIIYNTYGIHRAKPVFNSDFVRKSVFFQVDSELDNSEPILLNSQYITNLDSDLQMFLGFGKPSNYEIFPRTSLNTLPLTKALQLTIAKYIARKILSFLFNLAPKKLIKFINNFK